MATYDYICDKCGNIDEHVHGMLETPEIRCSKCSGIMRKAFSRNIGGFILKGGTPAINYREKEYRQKRSKEMARRQRERYGEPAKLKPNIAGIETGTWENAYNIAMDKDVRTETGIRPETYIPYVEKEKKTKLIV